MRIVITCYCLVVFILPSANVNAFHDDIYQPRVPLELLEELQDMDNPYPASPERIKLGKEIFFGKMRFMLPL